jgi:hypothetical protein
LLLPLNNPSCFFHENLEEIDMAAAAVLPSLNVVYRPDSRVHNLTSIHSLLELSLGQTNSRGAYLYRFDDERNDLELVTWKGLAAWKRQPGTEKTAPPSYSIAMPGRTGGSSASRSSCAIASRRRPPSHCWTAGNW